MVTPAKVNEDNFFNAITWKNRLYLTSAHTHVLYYYYDNIKFCVNNLIMYHEITVVY